MGEPKTIKFPKFEESKWVELIIQKGNIVDTGKATKVRLQKQVIENVLIPNGFEVFIPNGDILIHNVFSSRPMASIKGWKVNQILKTVIMEGLRNG